MDKPSKGNSAVGAVLLLIAIPLVPIAYVLSIGPVARYYVNAAAPTAVQNFYAPLEWLAKRSDLFMTLLQWYLDFWI